MTVKQHFLCMFGRHSWSESWKSLYDGYEYIHRNCLQCGKHQFKSKHGAWGDAKVKPKK